RKRKRKPDIHPRLIALYGGIEKFLDFGELDERVEIAPDLDLRHPQYCASQKNMLAPGQCGVKTRAHLQKACHPPAQSHASQAGIRYSTQNLEQGGLACAVSADDADPLALVYFEGNIPERPEAFARRCR